MKEVPNLTTKHLSTNNQTKKESLTYSNESIIYDISMRIVINYLHLISFCSPSPPEEMMLIYSGYDSNHTIPYAIFAALIFHVCAYLSPFIRVFEYTISSTGHYHLVCSYLLLITVGLDIFQTYS